MPWSLANNLVWFRVGTVNPPGNTQRGLGSQHKWIVYRNSRFSSSITFEIAFIK